jgi:hypothetical protein
LATSAEAAGHFDARVITVGAGNAGGDSPAEVLGFAKHRFWDAGGAAEDNDVVDVECDECLCCGCGQCVGAVVEEYRDLPEAGPPAGCEGVGAGQAFGEYHGASEHSAR